MTSGEDLQLNNGAHAPINDYTHEPYYSTLPRPASPTRTETGLLYGVGHTNL